MKFLAKTFKFSRVLNRIIDKTAQHQAVQVEIPKGLTPGIGGGTRSNSVKFTLLVSSTVKKTTSHQRDDLRLEPWTSRSQDPVLIDHLNFTLIAKSTLSGAFLSRVAGPGLEPGTFGL